MTAAVFIGFVAAMAAAVIAAIGRYINGRTALLLAAGLTVWFIYVGLLGYLGIAKNSTMRPPGVVFMAVPVLVFLLLFIVRWSAHARIVFAFPLWIIVAGQSFRIGVELFLHQLWVIGLIPKMLTFEGANVDIYIGATAPLIAWLCLRSEWGKTLALAWNVIGLLVLANVVVRAVLTAPGPLNLIHAEVPNLMLGTFPYLLVPAFFVPLAVVLHVLSIRNLVLKTPTPDSTTTAGNT